MEDLYYFERAAQTQVLASSSGGAGDAADKLKLLDDETCARFQTVVQEPEGKRAYADIFWEAWMRKLDASEPEYAECSMPTVPIKRPARGSRGGGSTTMAAGVPVTSSASPLAPPAARSTPLPCAAVPAAASAARQTNAVSATHSTWIELSKSALRNNVELIKQAAGEHMQVIASVKANAYGHGVVAIAQMCADAGIDTVWTGSFVDAQAIQAAGIKSKILMFAGALPSGMAELIAAGVVPTVVNIEGARAIAFAATKPTPVCVKVDSGLGQ